MPLGEWFEMSRPQRIAAMVLIALIVIFTAARLALPRNEPLPEQVEQRAIELAKFRQAIDTTRIDTVQRRRKKAPERQEPQHRPIEEIGTF